MRGLLLTTVLVSVAAPLAAQEPLAMEAQPPGRPLGLYAGVEPGDAQPPPAYRRVQRRAQRGTPARILTWPGFRPLGDGGSRFFVQTTHPVAPDLRIEAGRVVVLFRNTRIHLRNSARWLETRFFNTPVTRARLERRGRDMALVMYLRAPATPRLSMEAGPAGAFHYVYLDFAPGAYAPVEVQPPPPSDVPEPPPAPARALDPSLEALDDEQPPR